MFTRILIDCSQLSKIYYNVLFGSSTRDRHARHIYRRTFREYAPLCITISGGRNEQLDIIAGFLPRHSLYSDFLSFVEHIRFFHGTLQMLVSKDTILTCARKLAVKPAYSTARPKIKKKNN